jgi:hypothetical protein
MKSSQDSQFPYQSSIIVTNVKTALKWRTAGKTGKPGIPRKGLRSAVIGWPVFIGILAPLAEPALGDVDNAWIDLPDLPIAYIPALHNSGPLVILDDIGLSREFVEYFLRLGPMKIEPDPIFVCIGMNKGRSLFPEQGGIGDKVPAGIP